MANYFLTSILLLLCLPALVKGQTTAPVDSITGNTLPPSTSAVLLVYGNAFANSNNISGKLTSAFIKGGYINEDTKNTTLDRIKSKNRLGFEVNYGVTFVKFSKKRRGAALGYYLRYNEGLYSSAIYNENAFRLLFYGNKQFEGQTVGLSPLRFTLLSTRQIGGGVMLGKGKNTFWLGADFVQGRQHTDVRAGNTTFATAVDGNDLTLTGDISVKQSVRPTYKAGYGFALNGQWFTDIKDKVFLSFTVDNLGMVFWGNNPTNFTRDTTLQFAGLNLNDALQSDSSWQAIQDSLSEALLPTQKTKNYHTLLPFYLKAAATKYFNKFKVSLMVNYRYMPGYIPQGTVQATYMGKWFVPSLSVMYGGYGGFNTGIGAGFLFGKGYSLYIESMLNEGWIAPRNASGLGVGVKFYKSFYR